MFIFKDKYHSFCISSEYIQIKTGVNFPLDIINEILCIEYYLYYGITLIIEIIV